MANDIDFKSQFLKIMIQERLEPHVVAVLPVPFEPNLIAAMASLPRPSSHYFFNSATLTLSRVQPAASITKTTPKREQKDEQ